MAASVAAAILVGERADQIEHLASDPRLIDPREGLRQLQPLLTPQELADRVLQLGAVALAARLGQALEEEGDRRLEHLADLEELGGADPVRASLVLLDLLEGDAQFGRQRLLADTHEATA